MSGRPHNVLLASASPRRRRLIEWLGIPVAITSVETPEELDGPLAHDPPRLACALAAEKAVAAAADRGDTLILAFDTVVVHDGRVLGKPADLGDARHMLGELSGGVHHVVTGVALLPAGVAEPITFPVTTAVMMRSLDEAVVDAWLATGEALGCAGAYNIEHHLASVADDECYHNVAGLPLCHLYAALAAGVAGPAPEGLTPPVERCDAALGRRCLLGPAVCAGDGGRAGR